jgi:hypothetical protein
MMIKKRLASVGLSSLAMVGIEFYSAFYGSP